MSQSRTYKEEPLTAEEEALMQIMLEVLMDRVFEQ